MARSTGPLFALTALLLSGCPSNVVMQPGDLGSYYMGDLNDHLGPDMSAFYSVDFSVLPDLAKGSCDGFSTDAGCVSCLPETSACTQGTQCCKGLYCSGAQGQMTCKAG